MTANDKDTIYIDIDDEITAVIDKVRASKGKVVALVLPKRASTFQSIVNMKLLKRAADQAKKNLVLVTTESGLMPLAGAVGLHVAKTPTSRPEVPVGPDGISDREEEVDESDDLLEDAPETAATAATDGNRAVGDLASASAMPLPSKPKPETGIETVELDNMDATPAAAAAGAGAAKKAADRRSKPKKDKKLAVPNFDKFRLALILGGVGLVLLIVGGYFALVVMPKATIYVKTNASTVNTDVDMIFSTSADNLSTDSNTVPAKQAQVQKVLTGNAPATGQKNNGDKASGQVTFTNCTSNNDEVVIPAGTGISSGGNTYITQSRVSLSFSGSRPNGNCTSQNGITAQTVGVVAQSAGQKYNTGNNTNFTINGVSSVRANSSNGLSGGSDDIQTVISQGDIDAAKAKISSTDNSAQEELQSQLKGEGLFAVTATYAAGTPATTTSANVGDTSSSVTVTQTITYTMLGVSESHIRTLVDNDIKDQIDTSTQGILSQGITQAGFKLKNATATGASLNLQTTAEVGPSIDKAQIAEASAGKKSNEIRAQIQSNPDVTDVEVKMSPFWVSKAPSNTSKITVTIAEPTSNNDDN